MRDRPIIFSTEMVKKILDGTKTQTRRLIRSPGQYSNIRGCGFCCLYGVPGDRLWVRETFTRIPYAADSHSTIYRTIYKADGVPIDPTLRDEANQSGVSVKWMTPMFMPHSDSRITLAIKAVRVQRLWEISPADIRAEGFPDSESFREAWNKVHGYAEMRCWHANPWVWAISFHCLKVRTRNG